MVFCQRQLFLCLLYFSLNSWRWQTTLQTWFISRVLQIISFILSKRIILIKSKCGNWWSFIYVQNKNNLSSRHANGKFQGISRLLEWNGISSWHLLSLSHMYSSFIHSKLLNSPRREDETKFLNASRWVIFFPFFQEKLDNLFISNKVIQLHNDSSLHKN